MLETTITIRTHKLSRIGPKQCQIYLPLVVFWCRWPSLEDHLQAETEKCLLKNKFLTLGLKVEIGLSLETFRLTLACGSRSYHDSSQIPSVSPNWAKMGSQGFGGLMGLSVTWSGQDQAFPRGVCTPSLVGLQWLHAIRAAFCRWGKICWGRGFQI